MGSSTYKMSWNPNTGSYETGFWTPEQWSKFGESGGTVGKNGELIVGTGQTIDPTTNTLNDIAPADEGLFGLGTTNQWGTAMGLGGLAMKAIALPGQMEYYGAQTDLAKQQLASNKQSMADKKTFNAGWANASNNVMGSGLANRSFTGAAGYGTGAIGSTNPVLKNGY